MASGPRGREQVTAVSGASGLGGLFSSFSFLRSFFSNKSRRVCVYHVVGVGRTVQMYSLWPFCIQGLALGNPCPGAPLCNHPTGEISLILP